MHALKTLFLKSVSLNILLLILFHVVRR